MCEQFTDIDLSLRVPIYTFLNCDRLSARNLCLPDNSRIKIFRMRLVNWNIPPPYPPNNPPDNVPRDKTPSKVKTLFPTNRYYILTNWMYLTQLIWRDSLSTAASWLTSLDRTYHERKICVLVQGNMSTHHTSNSILSYERCADITISGKTSAEQKATAFCTASEVYYSVRFSCVTRSNC